MTIGKLTQTTNIVFGAGNKWSIAANKNGDVTLYQRSGSKSLMGKLKKTSMKSSAGLKAAEAHLSSLPMIQKFQKENKLGSMRDGNNKLTQQSMKVFMNQIADLSEKNRGILSSTTLIKHSEGKVEFSVAENVKITAPPILTPGKIISLDSKIDSNKLMNKKELKNSVNTVNKFMNDRANPSKSEMMSLMSILQSIKSNFDLDNTEKDFIKNAMEKLNAGINSTKK